MKRNLLSMIIALLVFVSGFSQNTQKQITQKTNNNKEVVASNGNLTKQQAAELRKKHANHLAKNPVNKNFHMSKSERKAAGIPPNKYMEQQYLLKMDPNTGRPSAENLQIIRQQLEKERALAIQNRIPGDAVGNAWIERGPNNVGGRTRAIMYDPVVGGNAVVAGGVSGGLWKNADITSTGAWTRVSTFPEHVNVQNITVDPNNSSIWYVGTGETYVGGDVNGNGAWKTTDAGATWTQIYGGGTTTTTQSNSFNLEVTGSSNSALNRGYGTVVATAFGPALTNMTYPLALMDDATAPITDACEPVTGTPYTNKIVLIRRGSCSFESKVVKAQNAGARAVIIMNNIPGGPVGMAEDAAETATIPCVMISMEDGDLLEANFTGTATLRPTGVGEFTGKVVSGIQLINDIVIKNNGGNSDIYMAVSDGLYSNARANNLFGTGTYGLYKSTNGGTTWTALTLPVAPSGNRTCPNDIEISANGDIWVSSRDSWTFGDGGGKVFRSQNNGTSFQQMYAVTANGGGSRVELEPSISDQNTMYILSELNQADAAAPTIEVQLLRSVNATVASPTFTAMALPAGNETRETTYGFTGAQAFYDLMIECDPTNPEILYVGGIDLYRSANAKTGATVTWTTISDWTANVHSDQHALTFKPGSPNTGLFGNDGGVYYGSSLSTVGNAVARNNGFNVTQFVGMAVQPNGVTGAAGDFFVAGAQDNGSQYYSGSTTAATSTTGAAAGVNGTFEVQGGDGGKPVFSQDSDKYYITNYVYNNTIRFRTIGSATTRTLNGLVAADQDMGLFYPAMTLDNTNDILYSDFTGGSPVSYQVRRYTSIKSGTVTRTNLNYPTLLNSYPTAIIPGKVTPTTLYVGTMNSRLLKLTSANTVTAANSTAGVGWSNISGPSFVGSISDIEFGANDNQIFVTMYNYGVNNIWYTPNGGTNWYRIEGDLPDLPVNSILQNPLNSAELMIGTDLGVWYANTFNPAGTADQALAWKQSYNGMSGVSVVDLDLQANLPTAPTAYNVYAATYGRGVFSGPLTNTILSVDENDVVAKSIAVYPTVNNGNVTISADKSYGKTTLELFDISGKVVYTNTIELDANSDEVNFGTLSAGNYILKLSGDDFKTTKRLIIQ